MTEGPGVATPAGSVLELRQEGLYCAAGDFYVDPWRPVPRAVLTHAHADHARSGSESYLVCGAGERLFRSRLGDGAVLQPVNYGERVDLDGVTVSLHPAGHVLGSAQVRIEHRGEIWVVSGDYKTAPDPTCAPFEPIRCHGFVTESTFGLPIFRWPSGRRVADEISDWWRGNRDEGRRSVLFAYSLGKAQRLLAAVDPSVGPIFTHGAVEKLNHAYRESGVDLPPTTHASAEVVVPPESLVIAPPSTGGSAWLRRFGGCSTGFASGWMRIRGARRRRAVDRGFVLSDHADWDGLLSAIDATGAETVWVTHGYIAAMVRWLEETGRNAVALATRFEGETAEPGASAEEAAEASNEASGAAAAETDR